ncbi:hypothetical protein FRC07_009829 [Ceratobasidium sp. 392]|nr:hypothetical protein FRC07_009829 [Ceratobasidium sp. 392]
MATLAIAAPMPTVASSTYLAIRDRDVSSNISPDVTSAPASAPAQGLIDSIIFDARSDLGAIMVQLNTLDFKNNGTQSMNQITNQLETAVLRFVGNLVSYAQAEQANGLGKRSVGGIFGLDPIGILKDVASIGNEVFAIINRVKDVLLNPVPGPEGIKQIGEAVSDILEQVSKALPKVVSIVLRILNAVL